MGTVHVLEACRTSDSVRAVICVTTDKCYENREWIWRYRENDPMGGYDPYSSSTGAAELAIAAYRRRSEEHTCELQSLMRISYAVSCVTKNTIRCRLLLSKKQS